MKDSALPCTAHVTHNNSTKSIFFQEQHKLGGIMPGLGFGWRESAWSVHFTPDNLHFLASSSSFVMKFFSATNDSIDFT